MAKPRSGGRKKANPRPAGGAPAPAGGGAGGAGAGGGGGAGGAGAAGGAGRFFFSEPKYSPDETVFMDTKSDIALYNQAIKNLQPFASTRDPVMQLAGVLGQPAVDEITAAGKIVFHSVGDTGATKGPSQQAMVADKMVGDFNDPDPADRPRFFYHLGDVVYSFGEDEYYYDQFYEPYRNYAAPIFAIPGNHDGMTYTGDPASSLAAFLKNFCDPQGPRHPTEAGSLLRTTMNQPGVYFTLESPFVNIIGLYSNVLEDPGVISSEGNSASPVSGDQKNFLIAELTRMRTSSFAGAVILALHHPPFTGGALHGPSPNMLQDLQDACSKALFSPHAVLAGHAHNYQRFTGSLWKSQIPFIVAGTGGHAITGIKPPPRTPLNLGDHSLESYAQEYGYLRVVVTAQLLSIEFHGVISGANSLSPTDVCSVDLKAGALTTARPPVGAVTPGGAPSPAGAGKRPAGRRQPATSRRGAAGAKAPARRRAGAGAGKGSGRARRAAGT
jgi:hypothetical protein